MQVLEDFNLLAAVSACDSNVLITAFFDLKGISCVINDGDIGCCSSANGGRECQFIGDRDFGIFNLHLNVATGNTAVDELQRAGGILQTCVGRTTSIREEQAALTV